MPDKLSKIILQTHKEPLQSIANLLFRSALSGSMIYLHGWPKLSNYMRGNTDFPDPFGIGTDLSMLLAIFAEVVCSVLLIFGALSRISVVPLIITMLTVIFAVNSGQPLIVNEKPFIFLMSYVYFLLAGAGKYSVDAILIGNFAPENRH